MRNDCEGEGEVRHTEVVRLNYGCCCCAKVRAALVLDSDVIWELQGYPDPHQEA